MSGFPWNPIPGLRNRSETTSVDLREVRRGAAQRPFRRRASERGLSVVVGLRPKSGSYSGPVPKRLRWTRMIAWFEVMNKRAAEQQPIFPAPDMR